MVYLKEETREVLKKTEDVVRYDDENAEAPTYKEKTDSATVEQPAARS